MAQATYILSTTLRGDRKHFNVHYCPRGGGGAKRPNTVTLFEQYKDELQAHLTSSDVKLYTVKPGSESVDIVDDASLRNAVRSLRPYGVLPVIAIKDSESDLNCPNPYGPYNNDVDAVMKKSRVPGSRKCHYCPKFVTSGTRYVWKYGHHSVCCKYCWKHRSAKESGWKKSNEGGAPWDSEAPDAPLRRDSASRDPEDVRHLNYLLCRLGFISFDRFRDARTSEYSRITARAVQRFRREYGIPGEDTAVYNEATQTKMQEVVLHFRRDGAQFI